MKKEKDESLYKKIISRIFAVENEELKFLFEQTLFSKCFIKISSKFKFRIATDYFYLSHFSFFPIELDIITT